MSNFFRCRSRRLAFSEARKASALFPSCQVVDFHSAISVLPGGIHKKTELPTGGNGGVTGPVVTFVCDFAAGHDWTFSADEHFFFVPKVRHPRANF